MSSSDFETEDMRPVATWCDDTFVYVTLADGRQIRAPLWWYPFLGKASAKDRAVVELEYSGVWWPVMDEGISVKAMLLGWKAPNAVEPQRAA
jgi:Protein of unknown function (DUF2442)